MAFSKFLDPKLDLTFKKIFGTERNKNILIHFLNDILGCTEVNTIQEIEFISTTMNPEIASERQSIVDVLCQDSVGNRFVVEMQLTRDKGFEKRAQYYAALIQDNLVDTLIYRRFSLLQYRTVFYFLISPIMYLVIP